MATMTLEQDAKRLFSAHSPLIRRCIERFSVHARDDSNSRVALGFMPLAPEKYARLAQIYQCLHQLMVCFYHMQRTGGSETVLEDWINLLQFDPMIIRSNQGWTPGARLPESEDLLRAGFERLSQDVLGFRQKHLKEVLSYARQSADEAARAGRGEAHDLFQAVSDQFFLRQRGRELDEETLPPARGSLSEQIRLPLSFLGGLLRNVA